MGSFPVHVDQGPLVKLTIPLALSGLLLVAARPLAQSVPAPASPSEVKAAFLKLLDRPRVPLDVKSRQTKAASRGVISERLDFAVEAHADGTAERVPALAVKPEGMTGRMPAVIVLHGTGGRKEMMWPWLEQLAHRGFVAIAIDGRAHGERGGPIGAKAYNEAITRAWRSKPDEPQGHPFYYDTCWDIWRTIDYLQTRPDVDPDRIGMIGVSKGGIETWLAGAVDDRIKVAVPAIAVQGFRWGLDHDRWQARANTIKEAHEAAAADLGRPAVDRETARALWSKLIPGITDQFDGPSMLRLFAGRSLLILNGEKDPNCPIEGAELAFAAARAAFHEVDADDHLKIMVAKGVGHAISHEQRAAALDWFVTWLKPTLPAAAARYDRARARALAAAVVGPPRPPMARRDAGDRPEHPRPSRRPHGRRPGLPDPATAPTAPIPVL